MTSNYKGGLAVGGSALEKSKLQLRRPTPDSDVLASSDDDREHVAQVVRPNPYPAARRPSSGWLQDIQPNRKYSLPSVSFAGSQPTTPLLEPPQQSRPTSSAFPWNTPSFSTSTNSRLKEVAPSPTSAYAPTDKSLASPTTLEADDGIGFLLNQQAPNPFRKAVRSQSYSIGQGDIEHSPVSRFSRQPPSANLRHRPSKPSLLGDSAVGLSQLREDEADEIESNGSEHGVRLPAGYWEREQKQALLKQAAMENARARNRATSTGSPVSQLQQQRRKTTAGMRGTSYNNTAEYAIEELDDAESSLASHSPGLTRRFSEHVSILNRDHEVEIIDSPQKPQWTTGNISPAEVDLSRRHSVAHYPMYNHPMQQSTLSNTQEEDEEYTSPRQTTPAVDDPEDFDPAAYFTGYGPASRAINSSAISAAHPDPVVPNTAMSAANPYAVPHLIGRQTRRLFIVTFKCSRADIYYIYEGTGLEVRRGDLVIVEGDRGVDLGQVTHSDLTMEEAKRFKNEANDEHFRWLVMFSQYSLAGTQNDSGMLGALARANGFPNPMSRTVSGQPDTEVFKPKMIKRLAQAHEISGLREKEGGEAKAKRLGAQKAADHKLPMEILDAEYQADYHKLTYFYYAESYVNFNELVTDLFKQYKVRIWMSAVNPASVVNPAGMSQIPPPSAIGPGAILNAHANGPLAVGPGFGSNNHRGNQQYTQAPARNQGAYGNYDDGFHAFSHQIPPYPSQPSFGMQPWAHGQQMAPHVYRGYYPNVTASGSPMNYGGGPYYPPTTYPSSYGGYGPTTSTAGYAAPRNYTSGAGSSFVPYASVGHLGYTPGTYQGTAGSGSYAAGSGSYTGGQSGSYAAGQTATAAQHQTSFDPAFISAMQNMSFGN